MKKLYSIITSILLVLTVFPAVADVFDTGKIWSVPNANSSWEAYPEILCSRFDIDNSSKLLFRQKDDETGSTTFVVLDENLDEVTDFTVEAYPELTATYYQQAPIYGPIDVYLDKTYYIMEFQGEVEELIQKCINEGYTRTEVHGDIVRYMKEIPDNDSYFYYEFFGYEYPENFYELEGTTLRRIALRYGYSSWGILGYEEDSMEETMTSRPEIINLQPRVEISGNENDEITLTQTLFNNDPLFEWIIPIQEVVEYNEKSRYGIFKGKKIVSTGFKVVSQDGTTMTTVSYPNGYCARTAEDCFDLYILNSKCYILVYVSKDGEGYLIPYSVIPGIQTEIKQVGEPRRVSVRPTALRHGTPVTVDLDSPATDDCTVAVVSASGKTVSTYRISKGTATINIETGGLSSGLYIVNVIDGKSTREATKIIVR